VAAALAVVALVVAELRLVVLAVVLALAITALLAPLTAALHRRACPRGLAALRPAGSPHRAGRDRRPGRAVGGR
jgi:predicted PurR-regulated permease PerM